MGRLALTALTIVAAISALPVSANATAASAILFGINGGGVYDGAPACGVGDGPSWDYSWLGGSASSSGGLLAGTWDGAFDVHDAGSAKAFTPNDASQLTLRLTRGGTGSFALRGEGSCSNATLDLTTQADGDRVVVGTLPIIATGGTGALRGLTGSGTTSFMLELGAGADNVASIDLTGDFDVADPVLSVTGVSWSWQPRRELTVSVTVANSGDPSSGDAFDVRATSVSGGTGEYLFPTSGVSIPAGSEGVVSFTMRNTAVNRDYTLDVTVTGADGLLAPLPDAVSGIVSFNSSHPGGRPN